jgi:hypothetical protein
MTVGEVSIREMAGVGNVKFGWVVVQFDKEASQNARFRCRKERDTTRGSPRSLAAQRTLLGMTIKLYHYLRLASRD